jgi:hypothetical protein
MTTKEGIRKVIRRVGAPAVAASLAFLAVVAVAAAASMQAPATARIGSRVTVKASHLDAGRYTLLLAIETSTSGALPTVCTGLVGVARTAVAGRVTISGVLPTRLACHQGVGPTLGHFNVRPGRYRLTLGIFMPPADFVYGKTLVKHEIRLTR